MVTRLAAGDGAGHGQHAGVTDADDDVQVPRPANTTSRHAIPTVLARHRRWRAPPPPRAPSKRARAVPLVYVRPTSHLSGLSLVRGPPLVKALLLLKVMEEGEAVFLSSLSLLPRTPPTPPQTPPRAGSA